MTTPLTNEPVSTDSICAQIEQINRTATALINHLQGQRDALKWALTQIVISVGHEDAKQIARGALASLTALDKSHE